MLDQTSEARLRGVNPDLVRVVRRVAKDGPPFRVIEGLRSIARQRQLVAKGASKTLNSRHLTGHAVDLVPLDDGEPSWAWPLYYPLANAVKAAAVKEDVKIEWGGDWSKFKDGPHWQLPWTRYPVKTTSREIAEAAPMTEKTDKQAAVQKAGLLTVASGSGATLADLAGQVAQLTEVSDVLKWVFVGLTMASIGYGLYALVKRRRA